MFGGLGVLGLVTALLASWLVEVVLDRREAAADGEDGDRSGCPERVVPYPSAGTARRRGPSRRIHTGPCRSVRTRGTPRRSRWPSTAGCGWP